MTATTETALLLEAGSPGQGALVIGDGILDTVGEQMRRVGLGGRAFVVTDRRVAGVCGDAAVAALDRAGFRPALVAIEGGERTKSLAGAAELYSWLAGQRAERRDVVVALGGGVVGDLAGFVAATYLRGVALVQVPTNVLAQVDSSVGGKTAIDLPQGKNLVGAFHPARLTLIDVALLDALPRREFQSGWAEVIKTAIIFDAPLFEELERTRPQDMTRGQLLDVIARCVRWKLKIVKEDPTEQGPRRLLNFGHTIAHGLEAAAGYGTYLHGEAVAIGMVGACQISQRLGLVDQGLVDRVEGILRRNDLPVRYDPAVAGVEDILEAMGKDKKSENARIRWILTTGLGSTKIGDEVPPELAHEVVAGLAQQSTAQTEAVESHV
jgi:3-dehydroquinate synthase